MNLQSPSQKAPRKDTPHNSAMENKDSVNLQTSSLRPKGFQTDATQVRYGANTPNGEFQVSGDKIKLSQKPTLGYESANTQMSDRAIESKRGY